MNTTPWLSLDQTGWPMPTSVTVSMSLPVARSRILQLEPLRPVIVDQSRGEAAVGADLERAQAEIFLALGLGRLVEDQLVRSPPPTGLRYQLRYCAPGVNAHQ